MGIDKALMRTMQQGLTYEEELFIEMGRKMFEERSKADAELRMRRRLSRSSDRKMHVSSGRLKTSAGKKELKLVE